MPIFNNLTPPFTQLIKIHTSRWTCRTGNLVYIPVRTFRRMTSYRSMSSQAVPQDLDFLINDLRFPPKDSSVKRTLGYLLHYVPYIKQEQNLRLVLTAFLNNPTCFGSQPLANFEDLYLIVEVFKLITDQKLKISQPSIGIKSWFTILRKELTNFYSYQPTANGWKVLPIIAGVQLSIDLRDKLYTNNNTLQYYWFFQDFDRKMTSLFKLALSSGSLSDIFPKLVTNLSLMSLAIFHNPVHNVLSFTEGVASTSFIIHRLTDMIVDTLSEKLDIGFFILNEYSTLYFQDPTVKHLNKLSLLLESYLKRTPIDHDISVNSNFVQYVVDKLLEFNRIINHKAQLLAIFNQPMASLSARKVPDPLTESFWSAAKTILFSETLIFQGILTSFLNSGASPFKPVLDRIYREISLKILHSLYYLNFVLISVGTGGFDSYNFIYYLALEAALGGGRGGSVVGFERMTSTMIGDYRELNLSIIHHNYLMRSKVLFVLGLWENFFQQSGKQPQVVDSPFVNELILPVCFDLVNVQKLLVNPADIDKDVTESAHSVLLSMFSSKKNLCTDEIFEYLKLTINQFPILLSSNQLSIAVETLGKFTLSHPVASPGMYSNTGEEFLEFLYFKCSHIASGFPISTMGNTIATAQPIAKYEANSTILHIEEEGGELGTDIYDANKQEKPKNTYYGPELPELIKTWALPPKHSENEEYQVSIRLTPETTREAMIFAFINLIPYLPLHIFTHWLNKTWTLIDQSNQYESEFLMRILWRVLSENLDLNRCEMAYSWWYEDKRVPELLQKSIKSSL